MDKIKVSYQLSPIAKKPPKGDRWFSLCKDFRYRKNVEIGDYDLAQALSNGQSWHCGIFEEGKNTENKVLLQTQVIAIDVDNDNKEYAIVTIDDINKRLEEIAVLPTFIYTSFSHLQTLDAKGNPKEKFRLVFILSEVIDKSNIRKWGILTDMLFTIIPEADAASLNISQLWLGGCMGKPIVINEGIRLNEQNLYYAAMEKHYNPNLAENRNLARHYSAIAEKWGVNLSSTGLPHMIFNENSTTIKPAWMCESIASELLGRTTKGTIQKPKTAKGNKPIKQDIPQNALTEIRNWQGKARDISPEFFGKWESGDRILKRQQRLYLISNLSFIYGGRKYYLEIMNKLNNKYEHDISYYENEATRFLLRDIPPMIWTDEITEGIEEPATNYSNLLTAIRQTDSKPFLIEKKARIGVEEGNIKMIKILSEIMKDTTTTGIYGINMDTGGGKSEAYINYISDNYDTIPRTMICVPTHALKHEIKERFKAKGVNVCEILQRPEIGDDKPDMRAEYRKFQAIGFYSKALQVWTKYIKGLKPKDDAYFDMLRYDASVREAKTSKVIITTHDLSLMASISGVKVIIYDEDVFKKVVGTAKATIDDLEEFIQGFTDSERFKPMLEAIRNAYKDRRNQQKENMDRAQFYNVETANWELDIDLNRYYGITPSSNCVDLCHAKGYCVNYNGEIEYSFLRPIPFYGCKVVVLSATLSDLVYSKLSGGRRIGFHQIEHLENKGIIVQDLSHTYSKSYFDNNKEEAIEEIKKEIPDWRERYLITFKRYAKEFEKEGFKLFYPNADKANYMAYGSTEGIDALKGQKLLVVGKYNFPNYVIVLWSKALGIELTQDAFTQYSQRVNHNGYSFKLMTYAQEEMRELHYYLMESEILQAIGRARTVREEAAHVIVLSDLPLFNSDEVKYNGKEVEKVKGI